MPIRLAIVGPGRVGTALGRRWREAGIELLGFVGRSPESVRDALSFCGGGRSLQWDDLRAAAVVVLTVGDVELPAVVAAAAGHRAPRSCSLWLHCSGRYDLDVLEPLSALGARRAGLHPVLPFPDAAAGYAAMPGRPAVVLAEPSAERLSTVLAERAGLRPIPSRPGDRRLYHAACALAANGLTAVRDLVDGILAAHGGLARVDADVVAGELMAAALSACVERGAAGALSGPVVRGDRDTLAAHLTALEHALPAALPGYRALMVRAVDLAHGRGDIDAATRSELARLLAEPESP